MKAGPIAELVLDREPAADAPAHQARCKGVWTVQGVSEIEGRIHALPWPPSGEVVIDATGISALDTSGAWLLQRMLRDLHAQGLAPRISGLRPEFESLMQLIAARVLTRAPATPVAEPGWLESLGRKAWANVANVESFLGFVGEACTTLLRSIAQPRRIRWRAILHNIQVAGFDALPITGLLSFLMGIVIAYQGADQLQRFGANIFVADLVGIAMLRELSPLLTAIIVAGRSGSAYTAQIGTMKVTEEIDALRTVGVGPQELLVLPKMLALIVVLPLLTVYTDVTGVLGGMLMARTQLGLSFDVFVERLDAAIEISTFLTGLCKAPVFAAIIALVGCHRGFQAEGSADSVGRETTISVVQAIFLVIVTDAAFSIVFNLLGL
jgi:phospholipid/cholesterol/gamma-HCH transport system permease protein